MDALLTANAAQAFPCTMRFRSANDTTVEERPDDEVHSILPQWIQRRAVLPS
jgi:hypothetical protein